jgi:hypothetical protein
MTKETKKEKGVFDEFTRKYQLSKTLRFELKPVGKKVFDERVKKEITMTEKSLLDNNVFEKDETIDNSYNQAKFYFDTLHQKFIDSALSEKKVKDLPFQNFVNFLGEQNKIIVEKKKEINELRKGDKEKNKIKINELQTGINQAESSVSERKKEFYKTIKVIFDGEAKNWKKEYQEKKYNGEKIKFRKSDLKQTGVNFLTAAGILKILKYEFPAEKENEFKAKDCPSLYVEEKENPGRKRYIFDSFDKFTTYLTKFQETRKNLYKDDGTSTAVATRIVDNFIIFIQNQKVFQEKYQSQYSQIGFDKNDIKIFETDHYKNCLLQEGIETIDNENSYNKIIGRLNKAIKEFRDKKESENKKEFKKSNYPLFKKLDKQILGRVEKEKQLIENEKQVFPVFKKFIELNEKHFKTAKELTVELFNNEFTEEYDGIYLKNTAINTISRRWFTNGTEFELLLPQKSKKADEKDIPKIKKFISLADVKNAVEKMEGDIFKDGYYESKVIDRDKDGKQNKWDHFLKIWEYEFGNLFKNLVREKEENGKEKLVWKEDKDTKTDTRKIEKIGYTRALNEAKQLSGFSRKKEEISIIKNYSDAGLSIFQMLKYFALEDKNKKDTPSNFSTNFYARYDEFYKENNEPYFIKYYNALRNFITKKPFNENKIKLNFEKGNLLGGWAESPEGNAQFGAYIFKKDRRYFLGITTNPNILDVKRFPEVCEVKNKTNVYQKMDYYQIKSQTIYGSAYKGLYGNDYKNDKKKYTDKELIKKVKNLLKEKYASIFPELKKEIIKKNYRLANDLAKDINGLNLYKLEFKDVNGDYIEKIEHKIKTGGKEKNHYLYLFEITNKDLGQNSDTKTPNIHTLYFKNIFSENNLKDIVFKLSGNAEVFYRPKSLDKKQEIRGKHVKKKIVVNRRYTEDKIMFHLPIVINMGSGSITPKKFNQEINKFLDLNKKEINSIGIDRGEKNLAYYSVINQKCEILDQGSLNRIEVKDKNGKAVKEIDYFEKLIGLEKKRLAERQSWEPITKIKDLKKGYISHLVRKICDLVIKYNAIVVLEDLNMRFKQIRGGIERSIYQQLEKALIDKLGYLVFKDTRDLRAPGGVLNGYQLTALFKSFEKMGKQTGIIFYTQADYTSITDPLTGFRKNIYISNSDSQEKIKKSIEGFKAIGWDDKEKSYFFTYNPIDFIENKEKSGTVSSKWTIYSKSPRIRREKEKNSGYWTYKAIDLNNEFENLFKKYNFEPKNQDILAEIKKIIHTDNKSLQEKKEFDGKLKNFYERFIYLFNLVLQIRNTFSLQVKIDDGKLKEIDYGIDFIASPVKPFFSTKAVNKKGETLSNANFADFEKRFIGSVEDKKKFVEEFNADANGAYNIARKGIMILEAISKNPEKPDLFITKSQWDKFVQGK